jgi:hypothetical protein
MFRESTRLLGVVFCLLLAGAPLRASTIDFEGFGEFDLVTTEIPGLSFSNAVVFTAGSSLNEFEFPPASGVNVIIDDGGPLRIDFAALIQGFGGYFTYALPLTLSAFAADDTLLGTATSLFFSNMGLSGDLGSSPNEFLEVQVPNIAYVTIVGDDLFGYSFALDDLVITTAAVPEPTVLALVLFGGIGAAVRRLRQSKALPVDSMP